MVMKREGRLVWLAWFKFRGDPLMIVDGVLKEILRSCCDVAVAQINYPSLKHNTQDSIEQARGRDTIKELMSYPKCRSVTVINNPARPGSNHREVNCINYN